jgi:predicted nucleotidyltransferase
MTTTSDLDILMDHVHEINAKAVADVTDRDIDILIAYYRNQRARRAAGEKPAKFARPKVDILGILGMTPKAVPQITGPVRRPK